MNCGLANSATKHCQRKEVKKIVLSLSSSDAKDYRCKYRQVLYAVHMSAKGSTVPLATLRHVTPTLTRTCKALFVEI